MLSSAALAACALLSFCPDEGAKEAEQDCPSRLPASAQSKFVHYLNMGQWSAASALVQSLEQRSEIDSVTATCLREVTASLAEHAFRYQLNYGELHVAAEIVAELSRAKLVKKQVSRGMYDEIVATALARHEQKLRGTIRGAAAIVSELENYGALPDAIHRELVAGVERQRETLADEYEKDLLDAFQHQDWNRVLTLDARLSSLGREPDRRYVEQALARLRAETKD
jgi:hypothetical protein